MLHPSKILISLLLLCLSLSGESVSKAKPYSKESPNLSEELKQARVKSKEKFEEYCKRMSKYELVKKH